MNGLVFDNNGLEDLQKRFEDFGDGEHAIPFAEIFPPDFMKRYTSFKNIDEMLKASGYRIEGADDFDAIPETAWDSFVGQRTKFASWDEMKGRAGEEWTTRKLGLD